jgi:hypothetical protein
MDRTRFEALTRALAPAATRRHSLRLLLGVVATGSGIAAAADATARHKRKQKSRCPADRRCGKKCCPQGKICAGDVCVIGQGVCPTGADFCGAGAYYICGGVGAAICVCAPTTEGDTRCIQTPASSACGACTTSADCADIGPGAVCVGFGDHCCGPTQGECVTPCLFTAPGAAQAIDPDSAEAASLRRGLAGREPNHR